MRTANSALSHGGVDNWFGGAGGIENPGFCRRRAELRDCACHEEPAYERSVGTRKRLSVRPEPSGVGEGVVRESRFFLRRNARRGVGRMGHFEDFLVTPPVAHVPRDRRFRLLAILSSARARTS